MGERGTLCLLQLSVVFLLLFSLMLMDLLDMWMLDPIYGPLDQLVKSGGSKQNNRSADTLDQLGDANSDCVTSLRSSERQVFTAGYKVQGSTETIQQPLPFCDCNCASASCVYTLHTIYKTLKSRLQHISSSVLTA